MKVLPLFAILFWLTILALTGYHIFYWFIYELRRRKELRQGGDKTVARIIDYKIDTDADGGKLYFPILEFFTNEGERVVVQSEHSRTYLKNGFSLTFNSIRQMNDPSKSNPDKSFRLRQAHLQKQCFSKKVFLR